MARSEGPPFSLFRRRRRRLWRAVASSSAALALASACCALMASGPGMGGRSRKEGTSSSPPRKLRLERVDKSRCYGFDANAITISAITGMLHATAVSNSFHGLAVVSHIGCTRYSGVRSSVVANSHATSYSKYLTLTIATHAHFKELSHRLHSTIATDAHFTAHLHRPSFILGSAPIDEHACFVYPLQAGECNLFELTFTQPGAHPCTNR